MLSHLSSVSLRRLQVFLTVCDTLHMARAAEQLGVAQPALSQQIKGLEQALGARLFHRRKRGIDLTAAGQACREQALALLERHAALIDTVQRSARGELGRISLGYVGSSLFEARFPAQLKAMQDRFPGITLALRENRVEALLAGLQAGDLDVALLRAPVRIGAPLAYQRHSAQALKVILPLGHPLAELPVIPFARLAGEPMIGLPDADTAGIMPLAARLADEAGVTLDIKWQVTDVSGVLGLVAAGLGFGLVPAQLAELAGARVVARPLEEAPESELWLVWHGERMTPALRHFLDMAREA